jgi:hypothetical protein
MSVYWLAPLIAVAILFALVEAEVALTGAVRRHDFRRFEDRSRASFARKFPLPKVEPSRAEERRKAVSPFLKTMHNATNAAQTTYHNAVARSTGCLAVAFLALVLDTSLHDMPSMNWLSVYRHLVEDVLIWVDAIAFIFVLILFFYARSASQRWIVARVGAECSASTNSSTSSFRTQAPHYP